MFYRGEIFEKFGVNKRVIKLEIYSLREGKSTLSVVLRKFSIFGNSEASTILIDLILMEIVYFYHIYDISFLKSYRTEL